MNNRCAINIHNEHLLDTQCDSIAERARMVMGIKSNWIKIKGAGKTKDDKEVSYSFLYGLEGNGDYFNSDFVKIKEKIIKLNPLEFIYDSKDILKEWKIQVHKNVQSSQ